MVIRGQNGVCVFQRESSLLIQWDRAIPLSFRGMHRLWPLVCVCVWQWRRGVWGVTGGGCLRGPVFSLSAVETPKSLKIESLCSIDEFRCSVWLANQCLVHGKHKVFVWGSVVWLCTLVYASWLHCLIVHGCTKAFSDSTLVVYGAWTLIDLQ